MGLSKFVIVIIPSQNNLEIEAKNQDTFLEERNIKFMKRNKRLTGGSDGGSSSDGGSKAKAPKGTTRLETYIDEYFKKLTKRENGQKKKQKGKKA